MDALRTCASCGFENAVDGKACPLCGASEIQDAARTVGSGDVTLSAPVGAGPAPATTPGRMFGGRYRVEALLGRGGMGQVFRVTDLQQRRELALKVLNPSDEDDPRRAERFRREIGALSKIAHPAVPRVHDWGESEGQLFFVTDLVDGHDLKLDIQRRGAWPVPEAAALAATVAEALASAHELGIVHRDVKPNNIMLGRDGSVRLLDFGLARGVGLDLTTLTRTGVIVGTPSYMSPEQFDGRDVDARTDVYSLGVVLFELLTARLPFTGQTPIAVALKHKTEAPPALRQVREDVPAWLERLVLRCLEKDPDTRLESASALAAELRQPHEGRRRRRLSSGDAVLEDDTDWALVLASAAEKSGWSPGTALFFEGRYFKLCEASPPSEESGRWTYSFQHWPEGEVFRRRIDYEQDCAERASSREVSMSSRLRRWLGGGS